MNLQYLNLSSRAYNILRYAELRTIEDVLEFEIDKLKEQRNVGQVSINEIQKAIKKYKSSNNTITLQIKERDFNLLPINIQEAFKIITNKTTKENE